jgi:O-methyltransferase involved in polyketide biosynthesis
MPPCAAWTADSAAGSQAYGSARTLDHAKPVALIMLGVLGHIDDFGAARSVTSQLVDALPSGSYLAIAGGVAANEYLDSAQRRYNAQHRYNGNAPVPYHLRRPDQIASFFAGLDLVEPGVVPCPRWKPDASGAGEPADRAAAYCGVARKP